MTGQKFVMVIIALFVGFGIGYVILNGSKQNSSISAPQAASGTRQAPIAAINHPPGPSVGERIAAIERDCELQMWKGSKIKTQQDLYDALKKMTIGEFDRGSSRQRRRVGIALDLPWSLTPKRQGLHQYPWKG